MHRGTRGHPLKLFYPDPRVSVRVLTKYSSTVRVSETVSVIEP